LRFKRAQQAAHALHQRQAQDQVLGFPDEGADAGALRLGLSGPASV
jgi:hypothetical protein